MDFPELPEDASGMEEWIDKVRIKVKQDLGFDCTHEDIVGALVGALGAMTGVADMAKVIEQLAAQQSGMQFEDGLHLGYEETEPLTEEEFERRFGTNEYVDIGDLVKADLIVNQEPGIAYALVRIAMAREVVFNVHDPSETVTASCIMQAEGYFNPEGMSPYQHHRLNNSIRRAVFAKRAETAGGN